MTPLHPKLCRLEQLNVAQSPNSVDVSRKWSDSSSGHAGEQWIPSKIFRLLPSLLCSLSEQCFERETQTRVGRLRDKPAGQPPLRLVEISADCARANISTSPAASVCLL